MKKMFVLPMLISVAMICSCQKQDSTAEAQLAQRKTELDVREEALVQKEKAVDEKEKAVANSRVIQSHTQVADPAQAEVERQRRIQQLPPELRALIPDRSRMDAAKAEKDAATQQAVQTQRSSEDARRKKMSVIAAPAAEAPQTEANSSPSPTPQ